MDAVEDSSAIDKADLEAADGTAGGGMPVLVIPQNFSNAVVHTELEALENLAPICHADLQSLNGFVQGNDADLDAMNGHETSKACKLNAVERSPGIKDTELNAVEVLCKFDEAKGESVAAFL